MYEFRCKVFHGEHLAGTGLCDASLRCDVDPQHGCKCLRCSGMRALLRVTGGSSFSAFRFNMSCKVRIT